MGAKKIKVGVVGLGRIGWDFHCHEIHKHPKFNLAGVVDPSAERCEEANDVFGAVPFASLNDLLKSNVDVVVIASPTHVHKAQALAAFRAKKHVILEKPMALNVKEAKAIAAAAKRSKKLLTVYQPHRFWPIFQKTKDLITKGKLGEIYHVKRGWFGVVRRNDWQAMKKYGGGMLNNYGAHLLDFTLALTGYDVQSLQPTLRRVATLGDAEDVVHVAYRTKQGAVGEVHINMLAPAGQGQFLEVYGTKGTLILEGQTLVFRAVGKSPKVKLEPSLASLGRKYPGQNIPIKVSKMDLSKAKRMSLYSNFAQAVKDPKMLMVKPEETLGVMSLMEAARAQCGKIWDTPAFK